MSGETTRATAEKLVAYCRENNTEAGLRELYHQDAVSVEAMAIPGTDGPESKGLEAIKAKHDWWASSFEVHSVNIDGPYLHGADRFGIIFEIDASNKETGKREAMKEVGVYTVANGKIVREEFFFPS